ncbi:MAG: tRNA1(Val) (adenine(37)-N6)-methyltransferase [Muribaculaceae bacterium]
MRNPDRETVFRFKQFAIANSRSAMKVGTDGVLLGAWCEPPSGGASVRVLDIGTGTGLIALMIAQRFPAAAVDAVEIDSVAAEEAETNVAASPWSDRVKVFCRDIAEFDVGQKYEMIVSNPPFFTNGIMSDDNSRAIARHAATLTFGMLMANVARLLADRGVFAMISPTESLDALETEACVAGLYLCRRCNVYTKPGKPCRRILTMWKKEIGAVEEDNLFIHTADGAYSEEYTRLTGDFYLKF